MGQACWRHDAQLCWKRTSCISCHQCFGKRRIEEQRKRKDIYSLQRKWWNRWIDSSHSHFCQSACVKNLPETLQVQENPLKTRIWSQWWYQRMFLLLTLSLQLTRLYRETCCDNMSRDSQNFLKINCPNCAQTLVSWRVIGKGQFFITLEEERPDDMNISCRDYTFPRSEEASQARGWIGGNTKIGPVLDVKLHFHQGRYRVDIMIESLFRDRTVSGVRVVDVINKYVTETSEENSNWNHWACPYRETCCEGQAATNAYCNMVSCFYSYSRKKWTDINPATYSQGCFAVSKFMIRLLRHDESVPREDDGAVRFDVLIENLKKKFDGTSQLTFEALTTFLAKGGGPKRKFQYCLNPNSSKHFLYFEAIQGHSGGNIVDPTSQDNVLLLDDFAEYICHIGNAFEMHSIVKSGLIPGGRSLKKDR